MASTRSTSSKSSDHVVPALSTASLNTGPAILACIIYFVTPALYFGIEFYVSQEYSPSYSYEEHYTSQLAVPVEYVERNTGRLAFSPRGNLMNAMFFANGILFLLGQRLLLSSFKAPRLATTRMVVAVGYMVGTTMLAAVPAGNKQEEAGLAPVHFIGAVLAIVLGNMNSLLTGITAERWGLHKIVSLVCGVVGLVGLGVFVVSGEDSPTPGLYQRSSIYPTEVWMFFTADMLMGEISKAMKEKDEEVENVKRE
ncbi:hypothetical protein CERZMDRAFT_96399 [Cercospora zeae-maydis SCOH1-5]|uniref:DUF998 domain-containing protein n=1 Tax=Cercospora zeae-maydis SCOH1-5 TaxID=717836 RepID=A0A6A6FJC0_9PEZI|nr:hypothetical protein CERZMDRAFT_96399 [Cercospora zeae-maydis SCOH1-5]